MHGKSFESTHLLHSECCSIMFQYIHCQANQFRVFWKHHSGKAASSLMTGENVYFSLAHSTVFIFKKKKKKQMIDDCCITKCEAVSE